MFTTECSAKRNLYEIFETLKGKNKLERILHIVPNMAVGGLETFIMNMYRNIDRNRFQFDFLVHYKNRYAFDDEIENLGGYIYRMSVRDDNNIFKYIWQLHKFFSVHSEYKIIHAHMESLGMIFMFVAKWHGVKVRIAHSHNSKAEPTVKGKIKYLLSRMYSVYATELFACSRVAGEYMFPNKKYTIINNAIDVKKFLFNDKVRNEVRKELKLSEKNLVIGIVGRFERQKNHDFALKVFKKVVTINQRAVLLLMGKGDLESDIRKKVEELHLGKSVKFLGVRSDMDRLYQALDVFFMPSLFEGLPVAGIEAQASDLNCIFADTVSQELKIIPKVKYISLDDNIDVWVNAIINAKIENRKNRYSALEHAGYEVKVVARDLMNRYQELLKICTR